MKDLLKTFLDKRGQFLSVTWQRPAETYSEKNIQKVIDSVQNLDEKTIGKLSLPVMQAVLNGATVTKRVRATNVRAGVDYDAKASVQDKRESGELPAENDGIAKRGMQWATDEKGNSLFPHVLQSIKTGERSFRFDLVDNSSFETVWLLDGKPIEKMLLEPVLTAKEKNSNPRELDCLNVKETAILEME